MRIAIDDIGDDGIDVTIDGHGWAIEAAAAALEAPPLRVSGALHVDRDGADLEVTGALDAAAPRVCERCGEDMVLEIHADVDVRYVPEPVRPEPSEGEDDEAEPDDDDAVEPDDVDDDIAWFDGRALLVPDVVREALALSLPARIACPDVPACDARTAALLASKGSSGDPGHPGFAALKKRG